MKTEAAKNEAMKTDAMDTDSVESPVPGEHIRSRRFTWAGALSLAAGVLGTALIFIMGDPLRGDGPHGSSETGVQITEALLANEQRLRLVAWLAALACAGLIVAAVRLGRAAGGANGRMVTAAGTGVAVLFGAHYASLTAGAAVASYNLTEPGPGVGEASLVVLNVLSLGLVGPSLALVGAVAFASDLARPARITAAVLGLLLLVPLTAWAVNLVLPLWLGITAATDRRSTN